MTGQSRELLLAPELLESVRIQDRLEHSKLSVSSDEPYRAILDGISEAEAKFHSENVCNDRVWMLEGDRLYEAARRLAGPWAQLKAELQGKWPNQGDPDRARIDRAVATLQSEVRTFSKPYQLLIAFAVENYLKGFIVGRRAILGTEIIRPNGHMAKDLLTHNLLELLNLTGQAEHFDDTEKLLLQVLSRVGTWEGRYPFALSPDGQKSKMEQGQRLIAGGYASVSILEPEQFDRLVAKIKRLAVEVTCEDCLNSAVTAALAPQTRNDEPTASEFEK